MANSTLTSSLPITPNYPFDFVYLQKILNHLNIVSTCVFVPVLALFGIVPNLVNIRVFRRLGYEDGVNVTLTALAVSDIGVLITSLVNGILYNPLLIYDDPVIQSHYSNVVSLLVEFPHQYFINVSSMVTAFAALERCLCVTLPLKVKVIITTRVAVFVNLSIYAVMSLYLVPQYITAYIDWVFFPQHNRTILGAINKSNRNTVLSISYYLTDLVLPCCIFLTLMVCSTIISIKLKTKSKWRKSISNSGDKLSEVTSKERKSARLLMTVSIVCICLLLPQSLLFTVFGALPEVELFGPYIIIPSIVINFTRPLQVINCSITLFIYFKMSSRFRSECRNMFTKYTKG